MEFTEISALAKTIDDFLEKEMDKPTPYFESIIGYALAGVLVGVIMTGYFFRVATGS